MVQVSDHIQTVHPLRSKTSPFGKLVANPEIRAALLVFLCQSTTVEKQKVRTFMWRRLLLGKPPLWGIDDGDETSESSSDDLDAYFDEASRRPMRNELWRLQLAPWSGVGSLMHTVIEFLGTSRLSHHQ